MSDLVPPGSLEYENRPFLVRARDAMIEAPEHFGLRAFYPAHRPGGPQYPILVTDSVVTEDSALLTYSRRGVRSDHQLLPADILIHQLSSTIGIVINRVDLTHVRMNALAWSNKEDRKIFFSSEGKGYWIPFGLGWLFGWDLPPEIQNLPEAIDVTDPDAPDVVPGARHGRISWVREGRLDPDRMLSAATSRFLAKQREYFLEMSTGIPDEEATEWPSVEEVKARKGEVIETTIPIEPPKPEGKIISFPGQKKRSKADT